MTEKIIRYPESDPDDLSELPYDTMPSFESDFEDSEDSQLDTPCPKEITIEIEVKKEIEALKKSTLKIPFNQLQEMEFKELDQYIYDHTNLGNLPINTPYVITCDTRDIFPSGFKFAQEHLYLDSKSWNFVSKFLMASSPFKFTVITFANYELKDIKMRNGLLNTFKVYRDGKHAIMDSMGSYSPYNRLFQVVLSPLQKTPDSIYGYTVSFKVLKLSNDPIIIKEQTVYDYPQDPVLPKSEAGVVFEEAIKRKTGIDLKPLLDSWNYCNKRVVISGSFVMQTLLSEKWEDSDIDIYTTNANIVYKDLKKYFEKPWLCKSKYSNDKTYKTLNGIIKVYENTLENGCVIQIIYCDNIWKTLDSFDTEVCMNAYDGTHVYTKDKKNLMAKKMHMKMSSPKREFKYASRGFEIVKDLI